MWRSHRNRPSANDDGIKASSGVLAGASTNFQEASMALLTLELEAATPYQHVWPAQQPRESKAVEEKQVEAAVEEQQAVAWMLNRRGGRGHSKIPSPKICNPPIWIGPI